MLKLHLGCGRIRLKGFVNVDVRYLPTVDVIENAMFLRTFKEGSVDLIYASHILEHFYRWKSVHVLQRWFDLLKPEGVLRLAIPNFAAICSHYIINHDMKILLGLLYGGQDIRENFHHCCWDFESISADLHSVGFMVVRQYDWQETEHADVDDCSQAFLPHMDKKNGKLMSLNVEAQK